MPLLNKLRHILSDKKTVLKNFLALGILQGTNFLIPLILLPYLSTTLGIENFGLVSFVQAVMVYFGSFTDYGFNVSATREIAVNKADTSKISTIFNTVLATKLFLTIVSGIVITLLVLSIPKFGNDYMAYLLGFTIVMGQSLLPVWFFQGVEQMKYITYLNLIAKIFFTSLIFIYVKSPEHYPLVLLFFGLGNTVSGIAGIFLAYRQFNLRFSIPGVSDIKNELVNGWGLFIANFSIVAYINSNLFILGLFTNNLITGYYSIAEKIVTAMRQLLVVFSQAIYPQVCQLAIESHGKMVRFYKQLYLPFIVVFAAMSVVVYFIAEIIVQILSGGTDPEVVSLLRLMCFVPLIVGLNVPAYQTLLAYRFQNTYTIVLTIGSVLNILLNLLFAPLMGATGTAWSVIITEIFITLGLHIVLHYRHKEQRLF